MGARSCERADASVRAIVRACVRSFVRSCERADASERSCVRASERACARASERAYVRDITLPSGPMGACVRVCSRRGARSCLCHGASRRSCLCHGASRRSCLCHGASRRSCAAVGRYDACHGVRVQRRARASSSCGVAARRDSDSRLPVQDARVPSRRVPGPTRRRLGTRRAQSQSWWASPDSELQVDSDPECGLELESCARSGPGQAPLVWAAPRAPNGPSPAATGQVTVTGRL
jgi:hypothetical protein